MNPASDGWKRRPSPSFPSTRSSATEPTDSTRSFRSRQKEILHSISAYYSEQADTYDHLDQGSEKRHAYTEGINGIIADDHRKPRAARVLHIACGTGRRAMDIRERSGCPIGWKALDIGTGMVETAKGRGLDARIGHWNEVQVEEDAYDSITFLYAFGHIPSLGERKKSLTKAFKALRPGGRLYFDVFNVDNPNEWGPEARSSLRGTGTRQRGL